MPTKAQLRALAVLLRERHDIVTTADLAALGFHREYAQVQVRARRWQRVHRGVYCAYTGPLAFDSRCAAALAGCGPRSALAGATAMAIHGMTGYADPRVHVVVPHDVAAPTLAGTRVTRSRTLSARSVLVRRGMRVVTLERALVAYSRAVPVRARAAITSAVQQGLTTPMRVRATIFAMGNVSRRRALLAITYRVEGGDRSVLERRFMRVVRRAGLPLPTQNHPLLAGDRRLWLDVCYPALRIAIEIDGRAYHLLSEDWEDDLARQNLVVLGGWLVLRFTADAIDRTPELVAAQVRTAIELRGADPVTLAG